MRVAIITPAYNVAAYIGEAIRSVLSQTYSDWRLIIVDDGSTDATFDIAAQFTDHRIRLVRQLNAGVSAARNRGIQEAGSIDAVMFLDADDWLADIAVAELVQTLVDCPWAVAACGRFARVGLNRSARRSGASPRNDILERLVTRNLFANGGHLLIAADALHAAGAFRTDLNYGEDWEYWTRIALLGEIAPASTQDPVLFVRERPDSTCYTLSSDYACYTRALDAIYANPAIQARFGSRHAAELRRRADAEVAWAIGRELIRHSRMKDGQRWLRRSFLAAPTMKRLGMFALSLSRTGQFRPYRLSATGSWSTETDVNRPSRPDSNLRGISTV